MSEATKAERFRQLARSVPGVRSVVYLGASLWAGAHETASRIGEQYLGAYAAEVDPCHYESDWGRNHLRMVEDLITEVANARPIESALDVGCGEGWTTERLARHARSVVAVDLSPLAIDRARQRCEAAGANTATNVRFEVADLLAERPPAPGRFDLVVAMDFIDLFQNPVQARRVCRAVKGTVIAGGHLLVATVRQHPVVEQAGWGPLLPRGARGIDRFLQGDGRLRVCRQVETETHLLSLYEAR